MSIEDASIVNKGPIFDSEPPSGPPEAHSRPANPGANRDGQADVVFWDGLTDLKNPQNWSSTKKGVNVAMVSLMGFVTPLASSFFAPSVKEVLSEFGSNSDVYATFVVSVYVLGWALGPLVIAPLSEVYGRMVVYHVCNAGFICFTIGCALATDLNMLMGFRFLQGAWGVAPLTIGPGSIADMVTAEKRGAAMSLWACGPFLGPVVGPVAGGFLSAAKGWRWTFWVLALATGVTSLLALIVMRETYGPVLLARKTKNLRKETGNSKLRSKYDSGLAPRQHFSRAIVRPTKLLFLSPICFLMSLYIAFVYGTLYVLFTTLAIVFRDNYGFSESTSGLAYLGTGIGMFTGLAFLTATSDRTLKKLASKSNGELKPEYRLPPLMYAAPSLPIGLFIYGWTVQYKIHWAVPLFGTLLFGFGQLLNFMVISTYLVDTFTIYAASATADLTVLRSILGCAIPLAALPMYSKLGYGWGNSVLAFVCLALCPIPYVFFVYGERIRKHPRFQVNL